MPEVKFSVEAKSINHARTEARVGGFVVQYDEPERIGGTNTGPTPLQYMLGALAACFNATGYMVAKEMGFRIHSLESKIEGSLNTLGYTGKDKNTRAGLSSIKLTVDMNSDADSETTEKWLEQVKTRCPVSDNLANITPIEVVIIKQEKEK
ncbi:MAG: OsmC family protein [Firmicutes bacterium]|nr:OsmC family protein [Bacillota bacterium]